MANYCVGVRSIKLVSFLFLVLVSQCMLVSSKVTYESPVKRLVRAVPVETSMDNAKTLLDNVNTSLTESNTEKEILSLIPDARSGFAAGDNLTDSESGKLHVYKASKEGTANINSGESVKTIDRGELSTNVKVSRTIATDKDSVDLPNGKQENILVNNNVKYQEGSDIDSSIIVAQSKYVKNSSNENGADVTDLDWLLNIYNPQSWQSSPPGHLSTECRTEVVEYLHNLQLDVPWAAKMSDASGRYASQFFFGNNFWLGSHSLCHELQNNATNVVLPPFPVRFNVLKLHISLAKELEPNKRVILLGVCLPTACVPADIQSMIQSDVTSLTGTNARSINVLNVRPVPGEYSLLADPKFHIVGGVAAVVIFLMIVGSTYETMLMYRTPRKKSKKPDLEEKGNENNNEIADPKMSLAEKKKKKTYTCESGIIGQCLLSFSVISNGCKILNCSSAEDSLTSIHGLRFLSLAWVIMVHTYLQVFGIAENKVVRTVTERNFMFQTISNATFSVDTFFFISGLLVTFLYFKSIVNKETDEINKSKHGLKDSVKKFGTLVFYRFIRLTPAYMFVLGLVELSNRWLKNISVFDPPVLIDEANCRDYWWRNALYINSLFPRKDMCMLWSWYMANDTQFYILGISMLLLAVNYFRYVAAVFSLFLVSSWVTTAYISVLNEYQARIQEPFALFDELYDKPWTRLGPYLIGIATGYILFKTKCRLCIPAAGVLAGWVLSLSCLLSLVYGLLHIQIGVPTSAAYVALGHTAWGMALAWIVIACCTGYGGVINILLSFRALYPLSRLTYCAYLVHPMVMELTSYQMDGPFHLHNMLVLILYLGNVVASFLLSFVISLAFEAPVVRLLKISMSPGRNKRT